MIVEIYLINRNYVKLNTISTLLKIACYPSFLKINNFNTKIKCIES